MSKKLIIVMVTCFVMATGLVVTLYAISEKIVHEPGSFLRVYQKGAASKSNDMDLGVNSWYIAGIADDRIYLGNLTAPLHMIVTNLALTDSQHVKLSFKHMEDMKIYKKARIKITPPYYYYVDGTTPALFRGKIGEWVADRFMWDSVYFDQSEPISPNSFALRIHNAKLENVLGKVQDKGTPHFKDAPSLLQKQIDGVFCTDGMLRYNKEMSKLVYIYYYRNEYVVYDTTLKLDYRGHLIDTFSRARINTSYVSSTNTYVLGQDKINNLESWASGNYLYINSALLAKNDFSRIFDMMAIIDVYDLRNNTYKFSFSLPNYDQTTKLRDFQVYNSKFLIGIYGQYLVKYDLGFQYFKDESL